MALPHLLGGYAKTDFTRYENDKGPHGRSITTSLRSSPGKQSSEREGDRDGAELSSMKDFPLDLRKLQSSNDLLGVHQKCPIQNA